MPVLGEACRRLALALTIAACTPSAEQIAERQAERTEQLRGLDAYMGELQRVHATLLALELDTLAPVPCAGNDLRARAHWPDERGPLQLRIVHLDFLRRFGADTTAWTRLGGTWDWITDSTLAGHFDRPLSGREPWEIGGTAERVAEMFARDPYLIVVRPLPELQAMPTLAADGRSFESGYYAGWMFVVERATATVVCQVELSVESSDTAWHVGVLEPSDDEMIRDDFTDNFFTAVDRGLADADL